MNGKSTDTSSLVFFLAAYFFCLLTGCGGGGESSPSSPTYAQFNDDPSTFTILMSDATDDLQIAPGGGPSAVIPYPPADVKSISTKIEGGYVNFRVDYNGVIPTAPQTIAGQQVARQGVSINLDTDNSEATGAPNEGIGGVDMFFGMAFVYGSPTIAPYVNYNFVNGDIHQNTGHIEGEFRSGGSGYTYFVMRFALARLGGLFPQGRTVRVGSWSEAESNVYHHFAFDPLTTVDWTIPAP